MMRYIKMRTIFILCTILTVLQQTAYGTPIAVQPTKDNAGVTRAREHKTPSSEPNGLTRNNGEIKNAPSVQKTSLPVTNGPHKTNAVTGRPQTGQRTPPSVSNPPNKINTDTGGNPVQRQPLSVANGSHKTDAEVKNPRPHQRTPSSAPRKEVVPQQKSAVESAAQVRSVRPHATVPRTMARGLAARPRALVADEENDSEQDTESLTGATKNLFGTIQKETTRGGVGLLNNTAGAVKLVSGLFSWLDSLVTDKSHNLRSMGKDYLGMAYGFGNSSLRGTKNVAKSLSTIGRDGAKQLEDTLNSVTDLGVGVSGLSGALVNVPLHAVNTAVNVLKQTATIPKNMVGAIGSKASAILPLLGAD